MLTRAIWASAWSSRGAWGGSQVRRGSPCTYILILLSRFRSLFLISYRSVAISSASSAVSAMPDHLLGVSPESSHLDDLRALTEIEMGTQVPHTVHAVVLHHQPHS